jgi:hypothetical protein
MTERSPGLRWLGHRPKGKARLDSRAVFVIALSVCTAVFGFADTTASIVKTADALHARLIVLGTRWPSGEVSWTQETTRYGNPAAFPKNAEQKLKAEMGASRTLLSDAEREARKAEIVAEMERAFPSKSLVNGNALIRDGEYLSTITFAVTPPNGSPHAR